MEYYTVGQSYYTSGSKTTPRVEYYNYRMTDGTLIAGDRYVYDSLGNITDIQESEPASGSSVRRTKVHYTYDYSNQNQLLSETHYTYSSNTDTGGTPVTYTYSYDTAGNILSVTADSSTLTYEYSDSSWKDLLTKVGGTAISYDGSGNPTNWYNGSKSYSGLTWENGRQLTQITTGGKTTDYDYDADGIRTTKIVNGTKHEYLTLNGKIVYEKIGDGDTAKVMIFSYDAQGRPFAVKYSKNNGVKFTNYFYALNQQGDVVKIFRPEAVKDADGNVIGYTEKTYATYTYDAWGKLIGITNSAGTNILGKTTSTSLANLNPLRYRGYYYDNETGFYYVSSRYYDPEIGRFINADDIAYLGMGGLTSYNLFAYCGNNPVMGYDPYGTFDWSSFGKGAGWLAIGITAICVGVSVLTCGVAAPAMMAVAAVTVTAGALTAVNGVSELGEAATGHNFVRDDVFRGNEKAYDVYSNTTAAVAEIGTAICGGWTAKNAPRIKAYNNIQNYNYTDTISDVTHMSRPYANSVLTQKQVIKYGKLTKDSFGYVFSAMGSVNGKEKLWRLGINTAKGLVWHWGHGF